MTSKPEAAITPKIPSTIPRIANVILTFCFILFTLAYAFSISITQAAAYSGVAAWLVQTHLTQSWSKTKLILIWPIGLFFLAGVLSVVTAVDSELSLSGLKKLLNKAIVFFWVMNALALTRPIDFLTHLSQRLKISKIRNFIEVRIRSLKNVSPLSLLVHIMIATGALSAAYGIFQGLTQPLGIWHRLGVHGSLSNLMTYSVILMLTASLALARILFDPRTSKTFLIGALVFLGGAMILTLIRQSWLGLFMAAIFLLFIKKRVLVLVPILLVGLILMFGPHTIAERLKSIVDLKQASNNERIMLWKAGWEVFKDYPLTGCGFKCLDVVADQYPEHPILQKYPHLHSNMQIAVETGAIGLCAWISIWIVYFVQLTRRSRQIPPDANERWVIFGSAAAVIAFLVAGMFENNFYDSEIIILMYFIMALPFVDSNNAKSAPSNPTSSSIPR